MDRNEAKLLLQACRPNGQDDALPAFAEALALVERDPELKTWWVAQQAFDRKFAAKLQEVTVPADLRATILAGRKIEQMTPRFQSLHWFALAAAFAILGVISSVWLLPSSGGSQTVATSSYNQSALDFLGNDAPSLATTSPHQAELLAWLQARKSPTGSIPTKMAAMPTIGCQTFAVHGHSVSLICFSLADGKIAHLFIVEKNALTDPPGTSPQFQQKDAWATATWSDANKTYLLATQAGTDELRQLL